MAELEEKLQQIDALLGEILLLTNRGKHRECYELLCKNRSLQSILPIWDLLMGAALLNSNAVYASRKYLERFLQVRPEDENAQKIYAHQKERVEAGRATVLFPLQKISRENFVSTQNLIAANNEAISAGEEQKGSRRYIYIKNPLIVRPYGIVVINEETIVEDSLGHISDEDIFHALLMIGENGDLPPTEVGALFHMVSGPEDSNFKLWKERYEWQIAQSREWKFAGCFLAPTQVAGVEALFESYGINKDRLLGSEKSSIRAEELILFIGH